MIATMVDGCGGDHHEPQPGYTDVASAQGEGSLP